MTEFQKFKRRFKSHPGVPIALSLMFIGFVAGYPNGEEWIGLFMFSLFWIPVLATSWFDRDII